MRPPRLRPACCVVGLAFLALAPLVAARDTEERGGPMPEKNFSNIHAEEEWIVTAFRSAAASARQGEWGAAARALQAVIDAPRSREASGDAAPYVQAVRGTAVYEGAWLVARHTLAAGGTDALAAYEREYGAAAETLLDRGVRRRDPALLAEAARRFLGLPAGRRAALLLVDLALERGDPDVALQWIQALEDLEEVSTEPAEALAPWRRARLARHALLLARDDDAVPAVRTALADAGTRAAVAADAVPVPLRRAPAPVTGWWTTGGDATRSVVPAALGATLTLRWFRTAASGQDLVDTEDPAPRRSDRPSTWLPPRAVASEEHLFVSDGEFLHVYDLATGRLLLDREAGRYPFFRASRLGRDEDEDRRAHLGLLEGHALSIHPVRDFEARVGGEVRTWRGNGILVLAAVPDGSPWPLQFVPDRFGSMRDDHVQALYWDGYRLEPLWRIGGRGLAGGAEAGGLRPDTRLYGAPAVYRGRAWVAGVRPARATPDRWEAWLFSVDLATGRVVTRTHLGTGTPMRSGRIDEVIPTSPAAACGRVVVGTSLGILAAVDADDGRVQWIYRYDRDVETERGNRRNRESRDEGLRPTSFSNEPPVLALERCYATPTDGNQVLVLFDRPRKRERYLESAAIPRGLVAADFMAEHVAGVVPGREGAPPTLVLVGQGESGAPPGPLVAARDALRRQPRWPDLAQRELLWREQASLWDEPSPTGFGADPFGRAALTAEEVFVPTRHGIAVYAVFDRPGARTHHLAVLDRAAVPEALRDAAPLTPYGNLIPIPRRGIVAVSTTTIAFWSRE